MNFLVCIRCITYNHAQYITDAFDGFVQQRTTFPFLIMVVDDASTDGEQSVIRSFVTNNFETDNLGIAYERDTEYAHISYAQHKTNRNCFIVVHYLKYNHYKIKKAKTSYLSEWRNKCKYEAICEGDDYWIDPLKLQKQVDFMNSNPSYVLCHTNFHTTPTKRINSYVPKNKKDSYLSDLLKHNYRIATQTVLYRRDVYDSLPRLYRNRGFLMGDYPLWIELANCGKFMYINDYTSVYRVLGESSSHSKDIQRELDFHKSSYACSEFYIKEFHLQIPINYKGYYLACMKSAFCHEDKDTANKLLYEAYQQRCLSIKLVIFYISTILSCFNFLLKRYYRK